MNENYEVVDDTLVVTKTTTETIGTLEELTDIRDRYASQLAGIQSIINDLDNKIALFTDEKTKNTSSMIKEEAEQL